jgi:hypothetical protein
LFVLFAALLIEHGANSFSSMRAVHDGHTVGSAHAVRSVCGSVNFSEV